MARLDRVERNGMHEVTQCYTGLHGALKANQHALGHVERHHAGGRRKRDEAGARRERNTNRETGVTVAAGADGIGQQHAVQPRVNDAVTGTQRNAAARRHEVWQLVVHFHVHGLGIRRRVAERLHHQIRAEAQAGQVFQFVAGHRAGGVL